LSLDQSFRSLNFHTITLPHSCLQYHIPIALYIRVSNIFSQKILEFTVNALKATTTKDERQKLIDAITRRERDPRTAAGELEKRIGLKSD